MYFGWFVRVLQCGRGDDDGVCVQIHHDGLCVKAIIVVEKSAYDGRPTHTIMYIHFLVGPSPISENHFTYYSVQIYNRCAGDQMLQVMTPHSILR